MRLAHSALLALALIAGCAEYSQSMDDDDANDDDDDGLSDPYLEVHAVLIQAYAVPTAVPEKSPSVDLLVELTITNDGPDEIGTFGIQQAELRRAADDTLVVSASMTPTESWDGVVPAGDTQVHQFASSSEMPTPPEGGYPCTEDVYAVLTVTYAEGWTDDPMETGVTGFTCYD